MHPEGHLCEKHEECEGYVRSVLENTALPADLLDSFVADIEAFGQPPRTHAAWTVLKAGACSRQL